MYCSKFLVPKLTQMYSSVSNYGMYHFLFAQTVQMLRTILRINGGNLSKQYDLLIMAMKKQCAFCEVQVQFYLYFRIICNPRGLMHASEKILF
jgi:hypothetical protein